MPLTLLHLYRDRRAKNFAVQKKAGKKDTPSLLLDSYLAIHMRRHGKFSIFAAAVIFLVIAMAGPRWGMKEQLIERRGIDIVIALDLSRSMLTADLSPSRIDRAKLELSSFIDSRHGDRIGIVAFAGKAIVACPLTLDYGAAKNFLKGLDVGMIPTQGTDLAGAINVSNDLLAGYAGREKVIVLLTDGEDTVGDPLKVASEVADKGVSVYTLGFGTKSGGPIPVYDRAGKIIDYKKGKGGETIISRINAPLLTNLAVKGGGKSFHGGSAVSQLMDDLEKKEKTLMSSKMYTFLDERFQYPLFLSFLLFTLAFLIPERRKGT
ncbi:MAG: VWA domain-containing protein [Proteobacteria bacterium]|nr:VWA domain-containing protein [Pseudomonadota bacterium]